MYSSHSFEDVLHSLGETTFIVEGARAGSTRHVHLCKVAHARSFAESAIILGKGNWWDRYIGSISALKNICSSACLHLLTDYIR